MTLLTEMINVFLSVLTLVVASLFVALMTFVLWEIHCNYYWQNSQFLHYSQRPHVPQTCLVLNRTWVNNENHGWIFWAVSRTAKWPHRLTISSATTKLSKMKPHRSSLIPFFTTGKLRFYLDNTAHKNLIRYVKGNVEQVARKDWAEIIDKLIYLVIYRQREFKSMCI